MYSNEYVFTMIKKKLAPHTLAMTWSSFGICPMATICLLSCRMVLVTMSMLVNPTHTPAVCLVHSSAAAHATATTPRLAPPKNLAPLCIGLGPPKARGFQPLILFECRHSGLLCLVPADVSMARKGGAMRRDRSGAPHVEARPGTIWRQPDIRAAFGGAGAQFGATTRACEAIC